METRVVEVATGAREAVVDLTGECEAFLREVTESRVGGVATESRVGGEAISADGLLHVFVPHATAGLALIELGAGSDDDLLAALADLLPADDRWRHSHGSRGHGRSHVLPALVAPFLILPVQGGRLALGTWQSVTLVDVNVDNRSRRVRLSYLPG